MTLPEQIENLGPVHLIHGKREGYSQLFDWQSHKEKHPVRPLAGRILLVMDDFERVVTAPVVAEDR